ncbi:MAG TPA: MauE/DoxX family redox-associated membrane protein [Trebonia sp.]
MSGVSLLAILREIQIPLLAALLIGGGTAKARRAITAHPATAAAGPAAAGPAVLFPRQLHRPVAAGLCLSELILGAGLLLTAGRAGAGLPALGVRAATGLLFAVAAGTLYELRGRRPEAGCGCFGELSQTPVSWRTIARALLLSAAALYCVGAPSLRLPGSAGQAWLALTVTVAEIAVLAALSPEIGAIVTRLSHTDPCELREVPATRTMAALRASAPWQRYRQFLAPAPADVWREGCWRFVVFPGTLAGRRVEVVFAVHLASRRPPVRVGVLDADGQPGDPGFAPSAGPLQLSNGL